jgi:Domain amino terminal to FKBP-type peptidyl-prolyl isomerase
MLRPRWLLAAGMAGLVAAIVLAASSGKVVGAKPDPTFRTEAEKAGYAVGANLARQLKTIAGDLDDRALLQGFNDARATGGQTRLTNEEINAILQSLRRTHQQKVAAVHSSAGAPATSTSGLAVFFKMDPRLTAAYGGDRWVSPPAYTRVGDADSVAIEARAQVGGSDPKVKAPAPSWTASDPAMVQVTPDVGNAVTITVTRPGTSVIHVSSADVKKDLAIKAEKPNSALQVTISQD